MTIVDPIVALVFAGLFVALLVVGVIVDSRDRGPASSRYLN